MQIEIATPTNAEKQIIAGFFDGDGSFDIQTNGAFRLKISQSQEHGVPEIFNLFAKYFPNGNISNPEAKRKQTHRFSYNWVCCGQYAMKLMQIIQEYAVIKAPQAAYILRSITKHKSFVNSDVYEHVPIMKTQYATVNVDVQKITIPYISGLFMAEGCVRVAGKTGVDLKISQTGCPNLLKNINDVLGNCGTMKTSRRQNGVTGYDLRFLGEAAVTLINKMLPYLLGPKKMQCVYILKLRKFTNIDYRQRTHDMQAEIEECQNQIKRLKRI